MGELHWTPDAFWNATVYDIERAVEWIRRKNDAIENGSPSRPLTEDDIAAITLINEEMRREQYVDDH